MPALPRAKRCYKVKLQIISGIIFVFKEVDINQLMFSWKGYGCILLYGRRIGDVHPGKPNLLNVVNQQ